MARGRIPGSPFITFSKTFAAARVKDDPSPRQSARQQRAVMAARLHGKELPPARLLQARARAKQGRPPPTPPKRNSR
jgi:hypothetical protein